MTVPIIPIIAVIEPKRVLIYRHGRHWLMHVILKRYGIGTDDDWGRGIWLTTADLPVLADAMRKDPTAREIGGELFICPLKFHYVAFGDFEELLRGGQSIQNWEEEWEER